VGLDADERRAPGAAAALRAAIAAPGAPACLLPLHHAARVDAPAAEVLSGAARLGEPAWLPRLLRRTPDLAWQGAVHEHVDGWLGRHGRAARAVAGGDVVHLGAVPELRRRLGKDARNLALLERRCAADADDAPGHGFLALDLFERGRVAEATAVAERGWQAWRRRPDADGHRLAVARALCALAAGDAGRARESAERARRARDASDLAHLHGLALLLAAVRAAGADRAAGALAAAEAFRAALAFDGRPEPDRCVRGASSWLSAQRLGSALVAASRPREALAAFDAALAARPGSRDARLGRAEALLDAGDAAAALAAVEPLLGEGRDGWLLAACAALALGQPADARVFLGRALAPGAGAPIAVERAARLQAVARRLEAR
jgi:tetratricopeptide (TPR) repeat protein